MLKFGWILKWKYSQQCIVKNCYKKFYDKNMIKRFYLNNNIIYKINNRKHNFFNYYKSSYYKNYALRLLQKENISTKRRRYFKIRKHQKKKYKKKRMGLSTIPWIPTKEKIRTYKLPRQSKLINKRFMRDNKGGRRYRLKKQR
ncbi:conserved Plasmodium protein, unknown function [Plasmodium sp. DRC-Itaito]|nr:conserved Plasmodium protein, unknown function [Plasmodium sp. DRC-Itaito]